MIMFIIVEIVLREDFIVKNECNGCQQRNIIFLKSWSFYGIFFAKAKMQSFSESFPEKLDTRIKQRKVEKFFFVYTCFDP